MDTTDFEAELKGQGFDAVERKEGAPGFATQPHAHPFDVRGLILSGEFILTTDGTPRTYRAGETFALDAGCMHTERFGPEGSTYMVGRKHRAPTG